LRTHARPRAPDVLAFWHLPLFKQSGEALSREAVASLDVVYPLCQVATTWERATYGGYTSFCAVGAHGCGKSARSGARSMNVFLDRRRWFSR